MVADRIGKLGSDTDLRLNIRLSFTGTELGYALDVCEAVMDVWQPTPENKTIINLPATVEMSTLNIYADQIEWMHRNFSRRGSMILSLHLHTTEAAGGSYRAWPDGWADRGRYVIRQWRAYRQCGYHYIRAEYVYPRVDPMLDISDIKSLVDTAEFCNQLPVHQRHPMPAYWYIPLFLARIRMLSVKAWMRCASPTRHCGKFLFADRPCRYWLYL